MEVAERGRLTLSRRTTLGLLAGAATAPARAFAQPAPAEEWMPGKLVQGGFAVGRGEPRTAVSVDGVEVGVASASGLFIVGFDRDAPAKVTVTTTAPKAPDSLSFTLDIAPVRYDIQRIDGLPPQTVTPTDPAVIARITAERDKKTKAAASRDDSEHFADGFILPLEHPIRTSPFGVQRVLNGEPKQPHYGVDLAAPQGAPIRAPAAGLVVLAEPDMFLEGGLTMIDHGQGLITYYLHQSRQVVKAGDRVSAYQYIGEVGMKGRATGPHLCWRMSWRGRHMDPSLLVGFQPPSRNQIRG